MIIIICFIHLSFSPSSLVALGDLTCDVEAGRSVQPGWFGPVQRHLRRPVRRIPGAVRSQLGARSRTAHHRLRLAAEHKGSQCRTKQR